MTEHEDNRVHYLIDACEVRGHLDIKPDDLSLILIHQRELGKEDALAHLAEHDKNLIKKVCSRFMTLALDKSSNLFACKSIVSRDDVDTLIKNSADVVKRCFLKEGEGNGRT